LLYLATVKSPYLNGGPRRVHVFLLLDRNSPLKVGTAGVGGACRTTEASSTCLSSERSSILLDSERGKGARIPNKTPPRAHEANASGPSLSASAGRRDGERGSTKMKPRSVQPVLWILAARRRPSVAAGDDRALGSDQYASMSPGERLHRALELSTFCRLLRNAGDRSKPRS
jgi:hypothetical protein